MRVRKFPGGGALGALALAVVLAAGSALAPGTAQARRGPSADWVAEHAERLGLNEATLAAIGAIVEESNERRSALYDEIGAAYGRMHEMLGQPAPDRAAVMAVSAEIDALKAEARRNRLDAMLRIHELLTPAQREELVRIREEEHAEREKRGARCAPERAALCPDAAPGPALLRCLADRWEETATPCRESVERLGEERSWGKKYKRR